MTQHAILLAADFAMLFTLGFAAFKWGYWRCRRLMGEKIDGAYRVEVLAVEEERIASYADRHERIGEYVKELIKWCLDEYKEKENEAKEGGRR